MNDLVAEDDELFYVVLSTDAPRVTLDPAFASITIIDIDCRNLTNPSNGQVFLNDTYLGSEATYTCDKGFALRGRSSRICQENEQWSDSEPVCEGKYGKTLELGVKHIKDM